MYNKHIKVIIATLLVALAGCQFYESNITYGILLILAAAIVVLLIYRHEKILKAFYQLRKSDMDGALFTLEKIKNPDKLVKSQRAYYYYLMGLVTTQTQTPGKAEKFFVKALNIGLRMKHDQAMAKLNLAGIYAGRRRKREAINYLNQAKKLDTKGMLADQIKLMKSQMGRI